MDESRPHPIEVLHYSVQLQGARRRQEDTIAATDGPHGPFVVIADGLGGFVDGDRASRTTVNHVMNYPRTLDPAPGEAPQRLREAFVTADAEFGRHRRYDMESGATLVVAYFDNRDRTLTIASLGDSLAFRVRDGRVRSLLSKETLNPGADGLYDYGRRPLKYAVGWDIGPPSGSAIEINEPVETEPGDRFVFASDGLESVPIDDLVKCLALPTARKAAEAMARLFLDAQAKNQDNVSFVVCYVMPL